MQERILTDIANFLEYIKNQGTSHESHDDLERWIHYLLIMEESFTEIEWFIQDLKGIENGVEL